MGNCVTDKSCCLAFYRYYRQAWENLHESASKNSSHNALRRKETLDPPSMTRSRDNLRDNMQRSRENLDRWDRRETGRESKSDWCKFCSLTDAAAITTACATTRRWSSRTCAWRARRSATITIITRAARATATIAIAISLQVDAIITDTAAAAAAVVADTIDQPWSLPSAWSNSK